jgi:hypothetical protein
LKQPATWKPVAKHVAPGGAALRRPGESAAQAQTRDDAEETAAATPETKPVAKKTAAAAQKSEGKPAAKSAAKKAKTAKKSSGS